LYQDTVALDSDLSTIWKTPKNTTPVPRPPVFDDVMHMDIMFGPDISLGNVSVDYCLQID
jgi:hypothetical protein